MDDWFGALTESDRAFVRLFVLQSGSLKAVASVYGVSYPTVRARLDRIIEKVGLAEHGPQDPFVKEIMTMVIDNVIDRTVAERIITTYERTTTS